ncbi:MAG: hypothetical protein HY055_00535 [Magnetospirillum sp.]|nr:hypothetical protein [Magnetospirillum sp.]
MKIVAALLLSLALAACAEVTTFRQADGSVFYHVNCGDSMKLESCRSAALRTCPKGYVAVADMHNMNENDPAYSCAQENKDRQAQREPLQHCPAPLHKDSYFACK